MIEDDFPALRRAIQELRAEQRDLEVLRLRKRCQELHATIRELEYRLRQYEREAA